MYAESELHALLDLAHDAGATLTAVFDDKIYKKEGRKVISLVTIHAGIPGIGKHPMSGMAACEALRTAKALGRLGPVIKGVELRPIRGTYEQRAWGHYSNGDVLPICDFDPAQIELRENEFVNLTSREAYALFQHKLGQGNPHQIMRQRA